MKLKATKRSIREGYNKIVNVGYCDLQALLNYKEPFAYSAGLYGWACDYYDIDGVCISSGYQPIGDKKFNYDLMRELENKASGKSKEERESLLKQLMDSI